MLEILTLDLDGWFSHDKTTLDFYKTQGITLIKGKTGAGKSTILEAIVYLLGGKLLRKKSSVKDFANKVLANGYHISLRFRVSGCEYVIEEGRDRGEKNGLHFSKVLPEEETLTASDPRITRSRVEQVIGMSYDELVNLFVLGQRHTQKLIDGTSGERSSLLVSLFGLERYDESLKKINEEIKRVAEKAKTLTTSLQTLEESLQSSDTNFEEFSEGETSEFEKEMESLRKEREAIKGKLGVLSDEKLDLTASIRTLKYAIKQASEFDQAKEEEERLQVELEEASSAIELGDDSVEERFEWLTDRLKKITKKKSSISGSITVLRRDLKSVLSLGNLCPINKKDCPVDVPTKFKVARVDALNVEIGELDAKAAKLGKHLKKNTEEKNDVKNVIDVGNSLDKVLAVLVKKPDVDETELPSLDGLLEKVKEKIDEEENEKDALTEAINEQVAEIASIRSRNEAYAEFLKFTAGTKEKIEALKIDHEEFSLESKYLAAALAIYKKIKMCKIDSVLELLSEKTNERLDRISDGVYSVEFVSQKENSRGNSMLDSLDILLDDGHKKVPISLASGGQSDYVALATLLSLYEVAATISEKSTNMLFLDEVFGSLDRDAVARVFAEVVNLADELGVFVKVISHKELNESLVSETWTATMESGVTHMETS